ncbi:hypothetical protein, partial [Pseudorhodoplanes sp.]|uniref:hypothetical protein n=1 Tax=Pseudorhodoplanes sp. TaxID=1934341 RepID=UPI003D0D3AD2
MPLVTVYTNTGSPIGSDAAMRLFTGQTLAPPSALSGVPNSYSAALGGYIVTLNGLNLLVDESQNFTGVLQNIQLSLGGTLLANMFVSNFEDRKSTR